MEWEKPSRRKWAVSKGIKRAEMDWRKRVPGRGSGQRKIWRIAEWLSVGGNKIEMFILCLCLMDMLILKIAWGLSDYFDQTICSSRPQTTDIPNYKHMQQLFLVGLEIILIFLLVFFKSATKNLILKSKTHPHFQQFNLSAWWQILSEIVALKCLVIGMESLQTRLSIAVRMVPRPGFPGFMAGWKTQRPHRTGSVNNL